MESNQKINSVYEKLREEIQYLELVPGQLVGEIETAERFKVSRTPVRSAFKQIESDGLVEIKSHIGTFVSLIDLEQITDVLFMREILEIEVMKRLSYSITEIQEFRLNYLLKQQEELFEKDLSEKALAREFFKLDNELHQSMFEFAGRSQVYVLLFPQRGRIRRGKRAYEHRRERVLRQRFGIGIPSRGTYNYRKRGIPFLRRSEGNNSALYAKIDRKQCLQILYR